MEELLRAEAQYESELNRDNPKESAAREKRSILDNYEIADFQAKLSNNDASSSDTVPAPTYRHLPRTRSREDLVKISNEKVSRVERSWYIISNRIGEVGLKVFLRMFQEYPELIQLFPFADDDIDSRTGTLILNNRTKAHVRAHATAVMRVVGTSVAGLTSLEDLVPRLRQVGATHKTVGVQSMHYDILFRHLMRAIRDEVGPDNWDQETEDAWDQAFTSISDLIKKPSTRLETEPLRGWGIVILVACTYFTFVTPFRFAGFLYGRARMVMLFNILDGMAALVLAIDLAIDFVQSRIRERRPESPGGHDKRSQGERGILFGKSMRRSIVKMLHKNQMDRWVPWPSMDVKVLLSFPLQWMFVRCSVCDQVGLHWTQLLGLLRLITVFRVSHFVQCAENNALLNQKLDPDRQLHLNLGKLLFRLAFITHVSACMWCVVARVGLGVNATEFTPSPFFPNPIFGSESDIFNSYSRAIYWAFVNLSGIGDVDSSPTTTLECWTTLIVHMIGAVFYAILTGNVIAILEEGSKRDNKIGTDMARLSNYMNTARVSEFSKGRIMKGFMMRNVLTSPQGGSQGNSGAVDIDGLDLNDEVLGTLPNYLRVEVAIYARAELIRRRDTFFRHCSNGFLVALSSSLSQTRTLLTGDYLMQRGTPYTPEFVFVQSGSLQVRLDQHTIKTLNRGDTMGKAWLLQLKNKTTDPKECSERTDWLLQDGTAAVSIRALSPCVLLTGLSTVLDISTLKHGYRVDFQLLEAEARGISMDETERRAAAMKGIAKAVRRFKARRANQQGSRSFSRQPSVDSDAVRRVLNNM